MKPHKVVGRKTVTKAVAKKTGFAFDEIDYIIQVFLEEMQSIMLKGILIRLRGYFSFIPHISKPRPCKNHFPDGHPEKGELSQPFLYYKFHPCRELNRNLRNQDYSDT